MLVFVKLLVTFSISVYIMCVMFVQRFEQQSRRFYVFRPTFCICSVPLKKKMFSVSAPISPFGAQNPDRSGNV